MVSPSDDRDGRPVLFRLGSDVHELRHAVGPERISGEWWRGHDKTRDYFDVEDEDGQAVLGLPRERDEPVVFARGV